MFIKTINDDPTINPFFDNASESISFRTKFDYSIIRSNFNKMFALLNDSLNLNYNSSVIKNSSDLANQEDSYSQEVWQKIFWSCLFSLMVIIALIGNSGVILIVLLNKQMRTVTNLFIVNLSISDILVSGGNVIFNFVYMLNGHWLFGRTYCKVSNFLAVLSVACSCFTLMAISVDRFIAIVYPLKPRMSLTTALNITVAIWFASSLLSLPNFIFSITEKETMSDGEIRIICMIKWPDGVAPDSKLDYYYNLAVLLLTYFLPITLMTLTYFRVATVLWGSKTIGECSSKQAQSIKSKRKIVKMMVLVLCVFGVCWLPYHIYFILQFHLPQITKVKHAQHIFLALYFLAMSTSMLNPPIYCVLSSKFRRGFRKALFCEYCKANSNDDEGRKNYLKSCHYLKKQQWPSSSEPQSTTESTTQKFKCSSSASSQYYAGSSNGIGGQIRESQNFGQVLTVYPNHHFSSRISTSANQSGGSLINIKQHQQPKIETTSLNDQLMILNDHKSPIKVCISSESNSELNNNIVLIKELNDADKFINNQLNKANKSHIKNEDLELKENLKESKNLHCRIKQRKFAITAKQLNRAMSTSQSYSSICLKNINNLDAIEMIDQKKKLEPASSCSSVYSKKNLENSQVDQV